LKESEEDGFSHGENLNIFIQHVLEDMEIKIKDLAAVSLVSGPGSFTGLRIGAATAKSLCYALNIPLIAIDSLTSLAALGREKYSDQNICAVIDARRMEVYNLVVDRNKCNLNEISADIIEADSYEELTPFVCIGDGAKKLTTIWKDKNCTFDLEVKSSARGQVEIAFDKFVANDFEDIAYWEPFYLKNFIPGKKTNE
jgi:tRNA threonylcarbamoyladenosine biosynthesis protein TsaB